MSNHQLIMNNEQLPEGYKQTAIGLIPEDWEVAFLGEIGQSLIGLTYRPEDTRDYGILVLRSSNVQNDRLAYENNVYVDSSLPLPLRVIVEKGDILICVRNGSKQLIGKCALIDAEAAGSAFGAFMSIFRTKLAAFVFYQFQSEIIQRQINEIMGATINQITSRDLAAFQIPLPSSLEEQQTIAQALSDTDRLIASLEKAIAKKRAIKTATMQQLLTGKKRLPGFGEGKGYKESAIGWIPEDWGVVAIREITSLVTNGFVGKATDHYTDKDDGITYIQGYNVEENSFNFNGIKKVTPEFHRIHQKSCLKKDDLLTIQTGEVGLTTIVPESLVGANCHALIISRFKKEKAYPWFYAHYFNSPIGRLRLRDLEVGTTMKHINVGELLPWEVPYPPSLEEQQSIATVLSDMDAEITALEARHAKTQAIKQGMMQLLLTGKTRLL